LWRIHVNLALIRIKRRDPAVPEGVWKVPMLVPALAALASVFILIVELL
jgi:hypothetical protein